MSPTTYTETYEAAEEGGFIAFVKELPGANSQGETLEEVRENLRDVVEMILSVNRECVESAAEGGDRL
jgi:predicted RNase H-like HicB family nuclease